MDAAHDSEPVEAFEQAFGQAFSDGNAILPLVNGVEIFPAMLEAVRAANETVDFLTFVYWEGEIAGAFAEALADRARAGVRVRVLLDALGARTMPDRLIEEMRTAGADVRLFRPLRIGIRKAKHRTHRKVLVVDGRVGFTGGVGIAAEWMGDARSPDEWRETHFRIEGPAVLGLGSAFLMNWVEVCGVEDVHGASTTTSCSAAGSARVLCLRSAASVRWSDAAYALRLAVAQAKRSLRITTAYFVPDETALELLRAAVGRGVAVQLLVPGPHTDSRLARWGAEDRFEDLLAAGVEVWRYGQTMLHAKLLTVDGRLSLIGSANFNHRSMSVDDELLLVVDDLQLGSVLNEQFERDLEASERLEPEVWRGRSAHRRLLEIGARAVRSVL